MTLCLKLPLQSLNLLVSLEKFGLETGNFCSLLLLGESDGNCGEGLFELCLHILEDVIPFLGTFKIEVSYFSEISDLLFILSS